MVTRISPSNARPLIEASGREQGFNLLLCNGIYYGYHEKKKLAGIACIEIVDRYQSYLKHVYVLPEHRRQGIAYKLVVHALSECTTPIVLAFVKRDNEASKKTLQKAGFKLTGEFTSPVSGQRLLLFTYINIKE